jgi:hypothetical protein
MNLRDGHEGLAIAMTVVELILVGVSAPMAWKRFAKHLRDEGLITKKPVEQLSAATSVSFNSCNHKSRSALPFRLHTK